MAKWLAFAGFVYVAAWVIGLVLEPGGPNTSASTTDLSAYYLSHQQVHLIQSYLIDGVAGIALIILAATLKGFFDTADVQSATMSSIVFGAGMAAASVSLVQAGMQQVLGNADVLAAGDAPIRTILALVNVTDTFKLLALALLSAMTSILIFHTGALPSWIGWLGLVLALTLILGGFSFLIKSSALTYVLFVSLPLLLVWVAAISVVVLRRPA